MSSLRTASQDFPRGQDLHPIILFSKSTVDAANAAPLSKPVKTIAQAERVFGMMCDGYSQSVSVTPNDRILEKTVVGRMSSSAAAPAGPDTFPFAALSAAIKFARIKA